MKKFAWLLCAVVVIGAWGCSTDSSTVSETKDELRTELSTPLPSFVNLSSMSKGLRPITVSGSTRKAALYSAQYITSGTSTQLGRTLYFNDKLKKYLDYDFVADVNFQVDGDLDVSYYIDENRPTSDLAVSVSSAAISRAMATWDGVKCSDLGMNQVPSDNGIATGIIAAILGFDGTFNNPPADVNHCGWMPGSFFDILDVDGSDYILGATFAFIWVDGDGNPTDDNKDGLLDEAFSETYYNDEFTWQDGDQYDVETIALHEAGHGLGQNHFGTAFRTNSNGKLHFSPVAVMNAGYSGVQTEIGKTDNAGHCEIWSTWPKK